VNQTLRKNSRSGRQKLLKDSKWASVKVILFFLLLIVAGFLLTSASSNLGVFQDGLFGSGILLWVVGIFGAVYGLVYRLAGPKAAKLAVVVLFLILLSELFFGKREEKSHDSFDHA
jgi:hypothetical protein